MNEILSLQNKHCGEPIFIIGSGPTLGEYDQHLLKKLGMKTCIGVNRTQYRVNLTYFLSSYISENLLAKEFNPDLFTIHTRPVAELSEVEGIRTLKRIFTSNVDDLSNKFITEDPYLITRNNVIFLATNLALIMGASQIIYVGCEQKNGLHFYNLDDDILNIIVTDMAKVISKHHTLLGKDHPYETPLNILRGLTVDPSILRNRPFYELDHTELLQSWVHALRTKFGVESYSCAAESVMIDAGAHHISLEDALDRFVK